MSVIEPREVEIKSGHIVTIRSATPEDAAALVVLSLHIASERAYTIDELDEVETDERVERARIEADEADSDRLQLVAVAPSGRLIGELNARGSKRRRLAHRARFGLSVSAAWRGRGVGRAMIHELIVWATNHPTIEKLTLGVFAENLRAVSLYRNLGFVEEGRRVREIRFGPGLYGDDLILSKFVKSPP